MSIYLIIALVATVFGIYIAVLARFSSLRKKQQIKTHTNKHIRTDDDEDDEAATTYNEKIIAFSYGAIPSILQREAFNEMVPLQGTDKSYYGLKRHWKITSKAQARLVLDKLFDMSASRHVDTLIESGSVKKLEKTYESISKLLSIPTQDVALVTSTFAYDLSRAIEVSKWCFWNDYLTESEMFEYIFKISNTARQLGKDWEEYSISYLLGLTLDTPSPEELDECQIVVKNLLTGKSWDYTGMYIPALYTHVHFNSNED